MEHLEYLIFGFVNALTPTYLFFSLIGCLMGTLVGVLPGLGPTSAIAILLPVTGHLSPTGSIIMLAGIYYGAMYGGSTTSILMNIPGEPSSVPTTFDGYQMAKQGRAGPALAIAAIGSFFGATIAILALTFIGPLLANFALLFGPAEYFGLLSFCFISMASLSGDSTLRGILILLIGVTLSTFGYDTLTGIPRFTYGSTAMLNGIDLISMVIGLFGIGEIIISLEEEIVTIAKEKVGKLLPTWKELYDCMWTMLRSTAAAFGLGLLPGMTPNVTSFIAYDLEKRISKDASRFGKGAIEGVCAPETANNTTAIAGFIPMLIFGIPTSPALALLMGGMMIYGLNPGPFLFTKHAEFFWTFIASMYIGNFMLLILNLPLVGMWAQIAYIPYKILAPIILGICFLGAYGIRNNMFDVVVAIIFGVIGYVMKKGNWPIAPMILGFLLGPMFEGSLRQALQIYKGSFIAIILRPIPACFIVLSFVLIGVTAYMRFSYRKRVIKQSREGGD